MAIFENFVKSAFRRAGYDVRRWQNNGVLLPVEFDDVERDLFDYVYSRKLSMTPAARLFATIMACRYVAERSVDGAFVECGVWQGGHSLLAAGVFKHHGTGRDVYLFDTFSGMTPPSQFDKAISDGASAAGKFEDLQREGFNEWCYSSVNEVRRNFNEADLLSDRVKFIEGDVLETLRVEKNLPLQISVLRLDTDWYESNKIELEILYPRLSLGGVLIIDDYGHWAGSKKAVDEYFGSIGERPFLHYTDHAGRIGIKQA